MTPGRTPATRTRRLAAGLLLAIAACACFGALDTTTKFVGATVPALMALWFRYTFQALLTTAVVLPLRGASVLRTSKPLFQCLRGLLLLISSVLSYFSLQHMPVGEFTALMMTTPLLLTLLAATVLKEQVSALRWSLVAGGFVGVLVIVQPGGQGFGWVLLLPAGLVFSNAWFQVLTSRLARTEDPLTMHLYTGWVGALAATPFLPMVWTQVHGAAVWAGLCFMGLAGAVGHFMLILAYQRAPASVLSPMLYTQIGFATLGGWVAFAHVPDASALAGMALIAACGAAGAWLALRRPER